MSLTTTSHETAPAANFASLLNRLTGLASNGDLPGDSENSEPDLQDSATSYQPSSSTRATASQLAKHISSQLGAVSRAGAELHRPGPSTSMPVKSLPKSKLDAQGMKLSYEDALRIHSRRQSPRPLPAETQPPKPTANVTRQVTDEESKRPESRRVSPVTKQLTSPGNLKGKHLDQLQNKVPENIKFLAQAPPVPKVSASSPARKERTPPPHPLRTAEKRVAIPLKATQSRAVAKRMETASGKPSRGKATPKPSPSATFFSPDAHRSKTMKGASAIKEKLAAATTSTALRSPAKKTQSVIRKAVPSSRRGTETAAGPARKLHGSLRDASATAVRTRTHTYLARPARLPDISEPQIRTLLKNLGLSDRPPYHAETIPTNQNFPAFQEAPKSEQRSSMVSMRLNQAELNSIRIRAEESGVSVCAYIRLCVLEAEQLRTQVKLALSAIRSGANSESIDNTPAMQTEPTAPAPLSPWLVRLKDFAAEILLPGFRRPAISMPARISSTT